MRAREIFEDIKRPVEDDPIFTESPTKLLYHGTSIEALAGILADGYVKASDPDDYDSAHSGVSLTSSLGIAKKFAAEAKDRDDGYWNSPVNDGVILVFDGEAIKNEIGVSRVSWDGSKSEVEHRTRGSIQNALKYLVQIRLDIESVKWWIDTFEDAGDYRLANALKSIPKQLLRQVVLESLVSESQEPKSLQILDTVKKSILAAVPEALEIWFYGSRATGSHKRNSDWDFYVFVPEDMSTDRYLEIVRGGSALDKLRPKIDVNVGKKSQIYPGSVGYWAIEEGKCIWRKND